MLTKSDKKWIQEKFATKDDLKRFATKDDLKRFATKDDLKRFATKDDLVGLAKGSELDKLRISFEDNLAKWKDELFTKIDNLIRNLKPAREEQTVIAGMLSKHSDTLEDHESRISKIEQASP